MADGLLDPSSMSNVIGISLVHRLSAFVIEQRAVKYELS